jgi:hypothetical protein
VYRWRFVPEGQTVAIPYSSASANDITGHAIPCITGISRSPTVLNIASGKRGESPLGVRSTLSVQFKEFAWDDRDGDFYVADRGDVPLAGFWQKLVRRIGDAIGQLEARHYIWYEGQDLSEAVVTRFDVRNLVANKAGASMSCDDPLQRIEARKAQFPRATGALLQSSINATQATGIAVAFIGSEISRAYGNTGSRRYLRIGREIILYTGWTETGGVYTLTGVERAALGTEAREARAGDAVQRVGRYERIRLYRVALDLMQNHATVPGSLIDVDGWEDEGGTFLPTLLTDATVPDPVDVNTLVGELSRDGLFNLWWDERAQKIKMQAVRPPIPGQAVTQITQAGNIMRAQFERRPDDRITRTVIRFNPRDPFSSAPENYQVANLRIEPDSENAFQADGTIRERAVNSRWINTLSNARLVSAGLLGRLSVTPEYATLTMDAKDAGLGVASFIDLSTPDYVDDFGNPLFSRWEVISWDHDYPSATVTVKMQKSPYVGRFAVIMENDAPDYEDATEAEREVGCWMADETTGLMPNGDQPYLLM